MYQEVSEELRNFDRNIRIITTITWFSALDFTQFLNVELQQTDYQQISCTYNLIINQNGQYQSSIFIVPVTS